jgi:hypothetical protein
LILFPLWGAILAIWIRRRTAISFNATI